MSKHPFLAFLSALLGCAALTVCGPVKAAPVAGGELTPESLPQLLALVRPQEGEWRHLKVRWLTDVVAARRRATAEDKPIVICYTGGAGYNEPLGTC
jgi:hypothetical protein